MLIKRVIFSFVLFSMAPSITCYAEIYRVIDEHGKVTYTDQPPENSNAENIQQQVEEAVKRNSAQSLETQRANVPDWVKEAREKRAEAKQEKAPQQTDYDDAKKAWEESLKQAKEDLKNAKLEQKKGVEAIDGDYIGKVSGGARPSEQYLNRQKMLAEKVEQAEKALRKIKKSKPKK